MPGLEPRGDFYVGEGGFKTAWFKDPDGNILSLMEGESGKAAPTGCPRRIAGLEGAHGQRRSRRALKLAEETASSWPEGKSR